MRKYNKFFFEERKKFIYTLYQSGYNDQKVMKTKTNKKSLSFICLSCYLIKTTSSDIWYEYT